MTALTRMKLLFASLYFVQGGAISYFSLFQKPYLNQLGVDRQVIGLLTTLLLLPFVLKIGFGYLSDRLDHPKYGRRKPLMIIGISLACLSFFLCGLFTPDKHLMIYSGLVLTASFCVALFDAATDGLAIDRIPAHEQGSVQSFMVGGKALGVILLSLSIGNLVEWKGYSFVFFSMAFVFMIPLFLTLRLKGKGQHEYKEEESKTPLKEHLSEIPFWTLAIFGVSYSIISFGSDGLVTLYLSDQFGLTEKSIGIYGSFRGLGAIAGSLLAGFFLSRFNPKRIDPLALLLIAAGVLIIGHGLNGTNYTLLAPLWGLCWAFQEVCFLALVMRLLKGTSSAFLFASLMAMANLGTAIGEGIATSLTKSFSFPMVFTLLSILIIIPFFFLFRIQKKELNYSLDPTS